MKVINYIYMKAIKSDYIPRYTYADYAQWEGRWELIEGLPYAMSPLPVINHQIVSSNINIQLSELLKDCGKCRQYLPVDWKIAEDTVVQPDNIVVCGEAGGACLTKTPVMIFEILSPSTAFKDKNIKYKLYEAMGVKYYVIVDIEAKVAEVFELESGVYKKLKDSQTDVIPFDLGECRIAFDFGRIWD